MRTERADVSQLLQQMRQMQGQINQQRGLQSTSLEGLNPLQGASPLQSTLKGNATENVKGFGEMFQQAINSVNSTQQQANALATAFETGDPKVSLAQVMVATQKANVSFQALTQVRNRLVDAYKDIMNMSI